MSPYARLNRCVSVMHVVQHWPTSVIRSAQSQSRKNFQKFPQNFTSSNDSVFDCISMNNCFTLLFHSQICARTCRLIVSLVRVLVVVSKNQSFQGRSAGSVREQMLVDLTPTKHHISVEPGLIIAQSCESSALDDRGPGKICPWGFEYSNI